MKKIVAIALLFFAINAWYHFVQDTRDRMDAEKQTEALLLNLYNHADDNVGNNPLQ